jgi:hypothetical protein
MTRWKAAAIHLCISATIGLVTAALLFLLWYPPPFFHAAGADQLILLLVGVDLALGPLLTLVVFKIGKPGLRFDLFAIGSLQTIALIYGMSVVLQARPIFLVAAVDRLVLVSADEITDADLAQGSEPRFRSRSWSGPRLVAARMPTDPKERSDLAFSALAGRDLQNLPKYYSDYSEGGKALLAKAKSLNELFRKKPKARATVERWLAASKRGADTVVWVPLQASKADLVMLLGAQTAAPLHAFAIDPW